jgi:primosomal protein N''
MELQRAAQVQNLAGFGVRLNRRLFQCQGQLITALFAAAVNWGWLISKDPMAG